MASHQQAQQPQFHKVYNNQQTGTVAPPKKGQSEAESVVSVKATSITAPKGMNKIIPKLKNETDHVLAANVIELKYNLRTRELTTTAVKDEKQDLQRPIYHEVRH